MSGYRRIFGAGPLGLAVSLALLVLVSWAAPRSGLPQLGLPTSLRVAALAAASLATVAIIVWSVRSLPVHDRGRALCTRGAFRWVRHPLYAAFLSIFNPALALFLDHWLYIVWAIALHPLWHWLIKAEEGPMLTRFGDEYREYANHTGRFIPRRGQAASGNSQTGSRTGEIEMSDKQNHDGSPSLWDTWLETVGWALLLFGLVLAFLNQTGPWEAAFNRHVDPMFWSAAGPDAAGTLFQRWAYGVMGAVVAGWAVFIVFMARYPFRRRERWAWRCVFLGITFWYVLDSALSVYFGVIFNVIVNTLLAILVYIPLAASRAEFK